jgi:hypothetical protein
LRESVVESDLLEIDLLGAVVVGGGEGAVVEVPKVLTMEAW